jgi:hypothetical protein
MFWRRVWLSSSIEGLLVGGLGLPAVCAERRRRAASASRRRATSQNNNGMATANKETSPAKRRRTAEVRRSSPEFRVGGRALPRSLEEHIFAFLFAHDLLQVNRVSRAIRDGARMNNQAFDLAPILVAAPELNDLTLSNCRGEVFVGEMPKGWEAIELRSLTLRQLKKMSALALWRLLTALEEVVRVCRCMQAFRTSDVLEALTCTDLRVGHLSIDGSNSRNSVLCSSWAPSLTRDLRCGAWTISGNALEDNKLALPQHSDKIINARSRSQAQCFVRHSNAARGTTPNEGSRQSGHGMVVSRSSAMLAWLSARSCSACSAHRHW